VDRGATWKSIEFIHPAKKEFVEIPPLCVDLFSAGGGLAWSVAAGVHVHADLIVGLPGEDIASFATGFDRLLKLRPQEIQVGMLKRLRGTPIVRHDCEWEMVYAAHPPYEVLRTKVIDFETMQRMRRLGGAAI